MSKNPKYSIIIPTCDRNDLLAICLEQLAPGVQTMPSELFEVIVTDDSYSANAEAIIREKFPWARWYPGPKKGPAANRNNGAKNARGEWLVFTDDDCLPSPNWLSSYRTAIENQPDVFVFEGCTRADRPRRSVTETSPINLKGGNLWSCNFAIRTSLFVEIKGFDDRYPFSAMEDVDLHLRINRLGRAIRFVDEALVIHPWREVDWIKHSRRHVISQLIYIQIHPEEAARITAGRFMVSVVKSSLKTFFQDLMRYRWNLIKNMPMFFLIWVQTAYLLWRKPDPQSIPR